VNRISHEMVELLTQRVMAIAMGYADCNDAGRLADDPIHKMLVGRDPIVGESLASQPTLSRSENSVGRRELYRVGEALADVVVGGRGRPGNRPGRRASSRTPAMLTC
jgi:hypothetical protein